ncbi:MAG: ABC transporter permease [Oscillospiraceae bacterium]
MLNQVLSVDFIHTVIRVSTPIIFAGLGGLIAKQAGILNLTLEGTMLSAALAGVLASGLLNSTILGVLFGLLTGIMMGFMLWYIGVHLKSDLYLTGIAINLLATGGTVFIMFLATGDKGTTSGSLASGSVPKFDIPVIKDIPIIGQILSGHNILTYLAFISIVGVYYFIYKTPQGLRIRAVGENPNAAESVGVNVKKIKLIALLLSGLFCSLGGIYLSMGSVNYFIRDMTAGKGFIGMSAMNLGNAHPVGTMIASLIFGLAESFSYIAQGLKIPVEFIYMIPYITTIVGLVVYSIKENVKKQNK